ncbi:hypothetical protein [Crocosphaera sp. Alani8]|uniref:hypothetical protein n=1 Tax=Crocosphaera sp. Alani8 TaxID=3038952 RepID=UPI00313DE2F9
MNLNEQKQIINNPVFELIQTSVKILSIVLISLAIFWELGNLYAKLNNWEFFGNLNWIFPLERIALISHAIEGMIGAYYAKLQDKNPLQYSLYAFFTGTPGLLELKAGQKGNE